MLRAQGAPRLWRDGELFLPGPQAPYYRRLPNYFRSMSLPHFRLSGIFQGVPPSRTKGWRNIDGPFTWLHAATCRYVFLLFEKTGQQ